MSSADQFLGIDSGLLVQGIVGILIAGWVARDALITYRATRKTLQQNPVVTGVSMAWDRDQQERFLQLIERLAEASEQQAELQREMAGAWSSMSDRQREDMHTKIERLLKALDSVDKRDVLAMIAAATGR